MENPANKLSPKQITSIFIDGRHQAEIAKSHGVSQQTISRALKNESYRSDWRVAGALMEKCIGMEVESMDIDSGYGRGWEVYNCFSKETKFGGGDHCYKFTKASGVNLPRAIIEACVTALVGRDNA